MRSIIKIFMKLKLISTLLLIVSLLFTGCKWFRNYEISEAKKVLMSEDDKDEIIKTCYWIIDNNIKDSSVAVALLTHVFDGRMSTSFSYYGQCPYEVRVKALEIVTSMKSPYKITDDGDALIIDYFLDWTINKKLIKTKDEIELLHPYLKTTSSSDDAINRIVNHDKVDWLKKYKWEKPVPKGVFHGENERKKG